MDQGLDIAILGGERPTAQHLTTPVDWVRLGWREQGGAIVETLIEHAEPTVTFAGTAVALPPLAFQQATQAGAQVLQEFVSDAVQPGARVADFFCGLGTLALSVVDRAGSVSGFELDPASIKALRATGRLRHTEVRDLFTDPPAAKALNRFDSVILDPPRAGADALTQVIAASRVPTVVMASCEPRTFARDAAILIEAGFAMGPIQPVDQFLFSAEIELAAVFRR